MDILQTHNMTSIEINFFFIGTLTKPHEFIFLDCRGKTGFLSRSPFYLNIITRVIYFWHCDMSVTPTSSFGPIKRA
jgi:hypothetical protein